MQSREITSPSEATESGIVLATDTATGLFRTWINDQQVIDYSNMEVLDYTSIQTTPFGGGGGVINVGE